MKYYQHGDVLVKEIKELPKDLKEVKTKTIMLGEFTGHSHDITHGQYKIMRDAMKVMYLQCLTACILQHQEHKAIDIPKGMYVVEAVREFDPFEEEINAVRD